MSHGSARHSLLAAGRDAHIIERGCNRLWLIDEWRQCCQWTPVGWPVHRHRHLNPSHPMNNCAYMTQEQRDPHLAVHTVTHWSDEILACPSLTPPPPPLPPTEHFAITTQAGTHLQVLLRATTAKTRAAQQAVTLLLLQPLLQGCWAPFPGSSNSLPASRSKPPKPRPPATAWSMQSAAHPPQLTAAGP